MGWLAGVFRVNFHQAVPTRHITLYLCRRRLPARSVLPSGSYNKHMIFLDMLGAAERQNNFMLCIGLYLEPVKFSNKLKGDGSRIYEFFAANVDSEANLVSP